MITIQDDMVIKEYGWERRITYPLRKFDDVLAVTSRIAQDIGEIVTDGSDTLIYSNRIGREFHTHPRNLFAVRDVINRGPVAFRMDYLRTLNYLNENYAPSDLDDADLSLRAWREHKWKVGGYWIKYLSRQEWSKSLSPGSTMGFGTNDKKNQKKNRS